MWSLSVRLILLFTFSVDPLAISMILFIICIYGYDIVSNIYKFIYVSQPKKEKKKFKYVRGYYGLMAMLSFLFEEKLGLNKIKKEKLGLNPLLPLSKKKNPLLPSLVINKDIYIYIFIDTHIATLKLNLDFIVTMKTHSK